MSRECGTCTKCCEGYLTGSVKGRDFYGGRPCHFVVIGRGCSTYDDRPKNPCITYNCAWLLNSEFPEWLKPEQSGVIIDWRTVNGIKYLNVTEAGGKLTTSMLSWLIVYIMNIRGNLKWIIDNGAHWIGNSDFLEAMKKN